MAEKKAPRARVTEEIKFIFSTADTCEFFQISRETLSTWQKKGAPKAVENGISKRLWNGALMASIQIVRKFENLRQKRT